MRSRASGLWFVVSGPVTNQEPATSYHERCEVLLIWFVRHLERACLVATLALRAEFAFVHVFRRMTIDTLTGDFLEARRDVTAHAGGARVRAEKREGGGAVIEQHPMGPTDLVMTAIATGTLTTVVHVLAAMAGVASRRQVLRAWIALMACDAADLTMATAQCVPGVLGVIEGVTAPIGWGMAGFARVAEAALMGVVTMVAAETGRSRAIRLDTRFVAALAADARVSPDERKTRLASVIELRA